MGLLQLEDSKNRDRPLRVLHEGAVLSLPHPRDLSHAQIHRVLTTGGLGLVSVPMPLWKVEVVLNRWLAHHGLGDRVDVGRLSYLVDTYEPHLTYDLHAHLGVDLAEMWRERRWRELLMLIDRLPRWSYYSDAMSNDPDYARKVAEAQAAASGGQQKDWAPPMTMWTPEVATLADLIDAVRGVQHAIVIGNSDPKKAPPTAPPPYPRPKTALTGELKRAQLRRRQEAHEALVARLLPHKAR